MEIRKGSDEDRKEKVNRDMFYKMSKEMEVIVCKRLFESCLICKY